MVKKYLILALLLLNSIYAFADFWDSPKINIVYSQNREYMLKIYPIKFPDNCGSYKYQRQLKKGLADTVIVPPHAILYHILNSDTVEIWNKPLINLWSPADAIVANDGKSVITINDWGSRGYQHTLVIYGEDGELIEDFKLEDISPFPLEQYPRSITSIYWSGLWQNGNVGYLDNDRIEIYFRNRKGEEQKRIFNIKTRVFE